MNTKDDASPSPDPNRGNSIGIVIKEGTNDFVLVTNINHKNPKAKIPGGRIEPGESKEEAVIREIHEETGLKLNSKKILWKFATKAANSKHYYQVFLCFVNSFEGLHNAPVKDGEDLLQAKIFSEKDIRLKNKNILPQHQMILKQALRTIRRK